MSKAGWNRSGNWFSSLQDASIATSSIRAEEFLRPATPQGWTFTSVFYEEGNKNVQTNFCHKDRNLHFDLHAPIWAFKATGTNRTESWCPGLSCLTKEPSSLVLTHLPFHGGQPQETEVLHHTRCIEHFCGFEKNKTRQMHLDILNKSDGKKRSCRKNVSPTELSLCHLLKLIKGE